VRQFFTESISDNSNLQFSADFMTRNIFKSSTKNRNSEKRILTHKSLMKILNNAGPKLEPCHTPHSWENYPKVRTTENLADK
jgi:hypothetical protein